MVNPPSTFPILISHATNPTYQIYRKLLSPFSDQNMSAPNEDALISAESLYNKLGTDYEKTFGENEALISVINRFLALLPEKASVLDCGSGTGKPVAQMVIASGRQVWGIGLSQAMVDISRNQLSEGHFELCDMLDYSPHDKVFDGIVASFALFTLSRSEITSMVRKWHQWLAPNGHLVIVSVGADDANLKPEMFDPDGQFAGFIPRTFMGHEVLLSFFTKAGWCKLLEDAGFQVVHTETNLFKPDGPAACDDEVHFFVIAKKL